MKKTFGNGGDTMSKFCKGCGMGNPDTANACLRCGKPLGEVTPSAHMGQSRSGQQPQPKRLQPQRQQSQYRQPQQTQHQQTQHKKTQYQQPVQQQVKKSKNGSKWALGLGAVVVVVLAVVLIVMLVSPSAPSKEWIKNNLPEQIVNYEVGSYDDIVYTSGVDNVEIIDEMTNDDMCVQQCIVTLKDERMTRTAYLNITSQKMDGNDFMLSSWNEYQPMTFTITETYATQEAKDYLENYGYNLTNPQYTVDTDNRVTVKYVAGGQYTNVNVSGEVTQNFNIRQSERSDEECYTYKCYADGGGGYDTSALSVDWNIEGTWECCFGEYAVVMEIKEESEGQYSWKGDFFYDGEQERATEYTQEGTFSYNPEDYGMELCNPTKIMLPVRATLWTGDWYQEMEITFRAEDAIAEPIYSTEYDDEYAFTRR